MICVCSVVLVDRAFTLNLAGEVLFLYAGDVLLINHSDRNVFLPYAERITNVHIDEYTVRRYMESVGPYKVDFSATPKYIRESFTHTALLRDLMHHLNSGNIVHSAFSELMLFSCLAVFASKKGFFPLLQRGMHSVVGKVRNIICTDLSHPWKLRDICSYLYMSESLLKKKLKEEGKTFSELLRDARMFNACRLMTSGLAVNQIAVQCGYISVSYFISVFRAYFGITPHKMLEYSLNVNSSSESY